MTTQLRDRLLSLILFAFAAAWSITVWQTVPEGYGGIVGARAVPLWLGIGLGVLAAILFVGTFLRGAPEQIFPVRDDPGERGLARNAEIWAVLLVGGSLLVYTFLMERLGFVLATLLVVAVLLRAGLGVRSLPVVVGMAVGLSFGVYFVMGTLMGVYLPRGTLVSVF